MITRCPECATAFKVTQAQLQARKGQVRCGHCGEVFDAIAALESLLEPEGPSQAEPVAGAGEPQSPPPLGEPNAQIESPEAPAAAAAETEAAEPATHPEDEACAAREPPAASSEAVAGDTASAAVPDDAQAAAISGVAEVARPAPSQESAARDQPLPELPFHRRSRRANVTWSIAAALLLVALNLQAVFYFRGAIALVWPASKPYIETLCEQLGCEIPLPKRAELMSIETSDLQADPSSPGVMVLSATVRNRAAFPQAFPALELTLTDERDQPLARRVLLPPEYLKTDTAPVIASCAGGVPACEVQVRMFLEATALKASGYRLYLFYP